MALSKNGPQYSKGTIEIRRSENKGKKFKDWCKILLLYFTISLGKGLWNYMGLQHVKSISTNVQYVTLPKYFSHPSFSY
jgi:hypothetical protein